MKPHDAFALLTLGAWIYALLVGVDLMYPFLMTVFAVLVYLIGRK